MEIVQDYLSKYRMLVPPQASKTKLVAEVVMDECGVMLEHTSITIRRGGVVLACHPTERSEIMRHVPVVLEVLRKKHNLRLSFIR